MSPEKGVHSTFPYHKNWKMSECHISYWNLYPTHDHIIPIARGGEDLNENIVTTSMKMNSAKSNFLLEEIGFTLHNKGKLSDWNGMITWYKEYKNKYGINIKDRNFKEWDSALDKFELTNNEP